MLEPTANVLEGHVERKKAAERKLSSAVAVSNNTRQRARRARNLLSHVGVQQASKKGINPMLEPTAEVLEGLVACCLDFMHGCAASQRARGQSTESSR